MAIGLLLAAMVDSAKSADGSPRAEPLEARFRGCDPAGWCRFWIESLDPFAQSLHRVRPDGIPQSGGGDDAKAKTLRERLGALFSNMIHQDKQIRLVGLRELRDGTFAATVTVNGEDVASDPVVRELRERMGTSR